MHNPLRPVQYPQMDQQTIVAGFTRRTLRARRVRLFFFAAGLHPLQSGTILTYNKKFRVVMGMECAEDSAVKQS